MANGDGGDKASYTIARKAREEKRKVLNDGLTPFQRQNISKERTQNLSSKKVRVEQNRRAVTEALSPMKGKVVEKQTPRGKIKVEIDGNSVKHIANSIAYGFLNISVQDAVAIVSQFEAATWEKGKEADKIGKHKKDKFVYFYYYRIVYNGKTLYFNVARINKGKGNSKTQKVVLYDITENLRDN